MLSLKTTLITVFLAAVGMARELTDLPKCAQNCHKDNVDVSGCDGQEDYVCLCSSEDYISNVAECVLDKCTMPQALEAKAWAEDTCKSVGVPV